jgi:hypothetical protein
VTKKSMQLPDSGAMRFLRPLSAQPPTRVYARKSLQSCIHVPGRMRLHNVFDKTSLSTSVHDMTYLCTHILSMLQS